MILHHLKRASLLAPLAWGALEAQSPAPARPFVTGQLGIFVLSTQAYPGSSERWVVPLPAIDLRIAQRIYVGSGAAGVSGGAGVYLVERGALAWSADLTLVPNRPEERADALAGMGDRGWGAYAGTTIALRAGALQASVSAAKGVEGRMGSFATAGLALRLPAPRWWFAQLGGLTVFGDDENLRWDFGVTPAQAVRMSSRPVPSRAGPVEAYAPGAGLREWRGSLTVGRALGTRLAVSAIGTLLRFEGDAARSPLTLDRTSWEAGVGATWRF